MYEFSRERDDYGNLLPKLFCTPPRGSMRGIGTAWPKFEPGIENVGQNEPEYEEPDDTNRLCFVFRSIRRA